MMHSFCQKKEQKIGCEPCHCINKLQRILVRDLLIEEFADKFFIYHFSFKNRTTLKCKLLVLLKLPVTCTKQT